MQVPNASFSTQSKFDLQVSHIEAQPVSESLCKKKNIKWSWRSKTYTHMRRDIHKQRSH